MIMTLAYGRVGCNLSTSIANLYKNRLQKQPPFCLVSLPFQCWGNFRPKHMDAKIVDNHLEYYHAAIQRIAPAEYPLMSTHLTGFQVFFDSFLHHFVLAKLAINSIRANSLIFAYDDVISNNTTFSYVYQNE